MAFTASDLVTLETAIIDLSSGNADKVEINGRSWTKSNLKELRETYDWMKSHVNANTGSSFVKGTFRSTSNTE
jgi:hypothetical protein